MSGIGADALSWMGEGPRLCAWTRTGWTCTEGGGEVWRFEGCARRSRGCTLLGSSMLSCEQELDARVDMAPFGRVAGDGPCMGLEDGSVICRGGARRTPEPSPALGSEGVTQNRQAADTRSSVACLGVAHQLVLRRTHT